MQEGGSEIRLPQSDGKIIEELWAASEMLMQPTVCVCVRITSCG